MQMREKVGKSRNTEHTNVFPMIWGSGGSKSRFAKAAGTEPAGQMRDEKLHAVVVRSRFRSEKVQNTSASDHFWKLRCRKSARRCGAKPISKWKGTKDLSLAPLLEVEMSKKCTPLWRESTFRSQNVQSTPGPDHFWQLRCRKSARRWTARSAFRSQNAQNTTTCSRHFWRFRCRFAWQAQRILHLVKSEQNVRVVAVRISRNDGRREAFEEDLQRCISRGRCSTKDMFIRDVRRSGRSFPERGCILEHQICRFAEMILRDKVQHFVWPGITFSWQAQYFRQVEWKKPQNALVRGHQLCTQLSIFEGSLAELLRFWCCQLQKLRKSRRIAAGCKGELCFLVLHAGIKRWILRHKTWKPHQIKKTDVRSIGKHTLKPLSRCGGAMHTQQLHN